MKAATLLAFALAAAPLTASAKPNRPRAFKFKG